MSSANKFEEKMKNNSLETRVALVEQSIGHMTETLMRIEKSMNENFIEIKKDIKSFDSRLWTNFYWTLGAMFTLTTFVCGILAKGFGWLN